MYDKKSYILFDLCQSFIYYCDGTNLDIKFVNKK